jgi:hypothetical protein
MALHEAFQAYGFTSELERLQKERPDLVDAIYHSPDRKAVEKALAEHVQAKAASIKARTKPPAKPAAKSAAKPGRRPGFNDNNETTRRVQEILRSR